MTRPHQDTLHRPPRAYPPAVPSEPLRLAAPPQEPAPAHTGVIQTLFPVVGGLGMLGFALVYGKSAFMYIALAMVVLLIGFSVLMRWSQKRSVRKRAAEEARRYATYLRERGQRAGARRRAAARRARTACTRTPSSCGRSS